MASNLSQSPQLKAVEWQEEVTSQQDEDEKLKTKVFATTLAHVAQYSDLKQIHKHTLSPFSLHLLFFQEAQ